MEVYKKRQNRELRLKITKINNPNFDTPNLMAVLIESLEALKKRSNSDNCCYVRIQNH